MVHKAWIKFLQDINVPAVINSKSTAEKFYKSEGLEPPSYYTGKILQMYIDVELSRGMQIKVLTRLKARNTTLTPSLSKKPEKSARQSDIIEFSHASVFADFSRPYIYEPISTGSIDVRNVKTDQKQKFVHFLLTISGRHENFRRFLRSFSKFTDKFTTLNIACFDKDLVILKQIIKSETRGLGNTNILSIVHLKNSEFSRGVGLNRLVKSTAANLRNSNLDSGDEFLMFLCDVDLVFEEQVLTRLRRNTSKGVMYYPIFFSQFDPFSVNKNCSTAVFSITECNGFWRFFSYGMVSLYYSDFLKVGGFNENIRGWGKEDLEFVDLTLSKHIQIFKASDRGIFHVHHDKYCDSSVLKNDQFRMCKESRSSHYGSNLDNYESWKRLKTRG